MTAAGDTLSLRQLNRATLARQGLLERQPWTPVDAVARLLGVQAQLPRPAYVGLWSRVKAFDRAQLTQAIADRSIVRATSMRATLHLMTAEDFLAHQGAIRPAFERAIQGILGARLADVDLDTVTAVARTFFARPRTFDALRDHLAERYPGQDIRAMAYAARLRVPLVQVPADTPWGYPGQALFVDAASWLRRECATDASPDRLVLRYLAAYGPASVVDAQAWLGLPSLKPVFDRLRQELCAFRSPSRVELFDLPASPRPGADEPAPVRLLPEWDSTLIGRGDERLLPKGHRKAVFQPGLRVLATFLVDGIVAGTWAVDRKRATATLTLRPFASLTVNVKRELESEADAALRFIEPEAKTYGVRTE